MQLSLFSVKGDDLVLDITKILNCQDKPLLNAIADSLVNFQNLPKQLKYCLSFSGGKDSHVLLGIYYLYVMLGNEPLDLTIKFADTGLEHESLYTTIKLTEKFCQENNLPFEIVKGKQSYWHAQFALGYPVPNHFNRWCTGKLKIQPIQPSIKIKSITGRHLGESNSRDKKLNKTCGSDTCGTDLIKDKYDPLIHWSNCLIWDAIYYFDGKLLYKNCFNLLKSQYEQAQDDKTGSLRLGCFMCPVISLNTIIKNQQSGLIDDDAVKVRLLLEELRKARRIKNPRTKKNGAIYIEDRRKYWQLLDKEYLLRMNFITQVDIDNITNAIESDYSYPPTYQKHWIDMQHDTIKSL